MATEKRLIDANALEVEILRSKLVSRATHSRFTTHNYLACIHNAPTVDAVEVVRCKDCKHGKLEDVMYYRTVDGETNDTTLYRCYYRWNYSELNKGEHFCSYGERRTDV